MRLAQEQILSPIDFTNRLTFRKVSMILIPSILGIGPVLGNAGLLSKVAVASVGILLMLGHIRFSSNKRRYLPVFLYLFLIFLALMFGLFNSASAMFGLSRLINWLIFIPFIFAGTATSSVKLLLRGLQVLAWVEFFGLLLQKFNLLGGTWGGALTYGYVYDPALLNWSIRYTSFIQDPNSLSLIFVLSFLVSLNGFLYGKTTVPRKIGAIANAALMFWGLLATESRGGILVLFVCIAVLILGNYRTFFSNPVRNGFVFFVSAWILLYLQTDRIGASIQAIALGQDISAFERANLWQEALMRFSTPSDYLIGFGFGGRSPGLIRGESSLNPSSDLLTALCFDNSWLKMLVECGAALPLLMGLLLCFVLLYPNRTPVRGSSDFLVKVLLLALLMRSFSVDMIDLTPWNWYLWVLIGAAMSKALPNNVGKRHNTVSI